MRTRVRYASIASVAALALVASMGACAEQSSSGGASADDYPTKQVSYVIPFDPGGESDVTARLQQKPLEEALGQSVVVSNREGGGGAVGWSQLAKRTKPDGYTIMGANLPHVVLQPMARDDAGYETDDLKWAYLFERTPGALIVNKDSPYKTLEEFIAAAKKKKLTVGGSASYSANHMGTLALNSETGIKTTYVPFTGTAAVTPALLGGQVDAMMSYNTSALDLREKGARVLAFASEERVEKFPDVPTFKELGYDIVSQGTAYRGVAVPKDTPDEIVDQIAAAFKKVNNDPEVKKKMANLGLLREDMGPDEAKKFIEEQKTTQRKLLEEFDLLKN